MYMFLLDVSTAPFRYGFMILPLLAFVGIFLGVYFVRRRSSKRPD